jgi:TRAP-type C4-dicarboxylate transport system substrate-binding protein
MKSWWSRATLLALLLVPRESPAAPRTWVWATISPEQSVFAELADAIANRIERNLRGEVKFKRRFGGVLGDELSTADLLKRGKIEVWSGSLGAMASLVPELRSLELPFQFKDQQTLQATLRKLKRGQTPSFQAAFRRRGFVLITLGSVGWRNMASPQRPIRNLDDLKGLRVRSQDSTVHLAMWRAFGAMPKTIPINDIAGGFDGERFGALDLPASFLFATSIVDKIKHYTMTRHMPQLAAVVMSKQAWESLPKDRRAHVADGMEEIVSKGEVDAEAFDVELHAMMQKKGIAFHELPPAEIERFRAACAGVGAALARTASKAEHEIIREISQALLSASGL